MKCAFGDRAEVTILDSREDTEHFKEKVGSHQRSGTTLIIERVHLQKNMWIHRSYRLRRPYH